MLSNISMRQIFVRLSLLVLFAVFLSACATVPGTGRRQLSLISDESLVKSASAQYTKLINKATLSTDTEKTASVLKVGKKISQAAEAYLKEYGLTADIASYKWEFNLIESSEVNAFCMPGGKIAFYTGILPLCKDEAGIAVVMGHEVGHAIAKHNKEQASQNVLTAIGALILNTSLLLGGLDPDLASASTEHVTDGVGMAILLPYSRAHESEADRIGLSLMAMAGYDPHQAVGFWERMSAKDDNKKLHFSSTHPTNEKRITDIKKFIPEALIRYKPKEENSLEKEQTAKETEKKQTAEKQTAKEKTSETEKEKAEGKAEEKAE